LIQINFHQKFIKNLKSGDHTKIIKQSAARLGFDYCGMTPAIHLEEDARRLESWLSKGFHGGMTYMENYFEVRVDPTKLLPGARSVITLLLNYFPHLHQTGESPKVSKYAYGQDYHGVIKNKLSEMIAEIRSKIGDFQGRGFVDSAPVLERSWAVKSGLGWIGKNGNLINKGSGSFFFICTLIVDLVLDYDEPYARDFCGTCTKCIDSCPTGAILDDRVVDGSKCISYFTIELKESLIPAEMKDKFDNWMFGCDVCQDVCPWNRFAETTREGSFSPIAEILQFSTRDWEELTEERFKKIFYNSPLKRAKFKGIKRNLKFIEHP
jgi:epoxyqueuosine reductase